MFSRLQKFILREAMWGKSATTSSFLAFYNHGVKSPAHEDQQSSVIRSIERLVMQGVLVAYGRKTQGKFFIERVRLTSKGRVEVKKLFTQTQLQLSAKKKKYANLKKS